MDYCIYYFSDIYTKTFLFVRSLHVNYKEMQHLELDENLFDLLENDAEPQRRQYTNVMFRAR